MSNRKPKLTKDGKIDKRSLNKGNPNIKNHGFAVNRENIKTRKPRTKPKELVELGFEYSQKNKKELNKTVHAISQMNKEELIEIIDSNEVAILNVIVAKFMLNTADKPAFQSIRTIFELLDPSYFADEINSNQIGTLINNDAIFSSLTQEELIVLRNIEQRYNEVQNKEIEISIE